jgi:hypothetical protein
MTGITTASFTTTTPTFPTAASSSIATTSTTPVDFTEPADFMAKDEDSPAEASMGLHRHTASLAPTQAHSAALIMEESLEASPLAASRALAEASMAVEVSTEAAVGVAGNSVQYCRRN